MSNESQEIAATNAATASLQTAAKKALSSTTQMLSRMWLFFLISFLFIQGMSEFFLSYSKLAAQSNSLYVIGQLGLALTSLFESLLLLMVIPIAVATTQTQAWSILFTSVKKYTADLVIEGLRVMVSVLLWSLLLILPGFWRQIRLSFVPWVVMLDKNYGDKEGALDALKESERLTQNIVWPLIGITLVIYIVDIYLESLVRQFHIPSAPIIPITLLAANFILQIYWTAFLTHLYLLRKDQNLPLNKSV